VVCCGVYTAVFLVGILMGVQAEERELSSEMGLNRRRWNNM